MNGLLSIKILRLRYVYRIIMLPVVLYGCEIWSLILSEKCRPRVFGHRVLRKLFGPKKDEVTGD
jgi:hypothetical protein